MNDASFGSESALASAVFGLWLGVLRAALEPIAYMRLVPRLRRITSVQQLEIGPGDAD